jgi:hypothetical protein
MPGMYTRTRMMMKMLTMLMVVGIVGACLVGCGGETDSTESRSEGTTVRGTPGGSSAPTQRSSTSGSSRSGEYQPPSSGTRYDATVSREEIVAITPEDAKVQTDPVVVIQVLTDAEDPKSRQTAARTLGRGGDFTALPALLEALSDENVTVRSYAISAINDITHMKFRYDPKAPIAIREPQARDMVNYFRKHDVID